MKRKILIITIICIIGILWGLYFKINIALLLCVIVGLFGIVFKFKFVVVLTIIMSFATIYSNNVKSKYDDINFDNKIITVKALVVEKTEENYYEKYLLKINQLNNSKQYKNYYILLLTKKSNTDIQINDNIEIKGIFELGEKNSNYKSFNYNEYLKSEKIIGIMNEENIKQKEVEHNISYNKKFLTDIYDFIDQTIEQYFQQDEASVIKALILGNSDYIKKETTTYFSDSSLSYILAISGMHITYIIMFINTVLKRASKNKKSIIIITILIFYNILIGYKISLIRSIIMNCMFIISQLLHRKSDSITNLSLASLIILIINPYSINSYSYIFSFGATLGIILFYNKFELLLQRFFILKNQSKLVTYIRSSIAISISANIIIIPFMIIFFHKISWIFIISAFLANIILALIFPVLIIFFIVSLIPINIAKIIAQIVKILIDILIENAKIFSNKAFYIYVIRPFFITVVYYYINIIGIFLLFKSDKKWKKIIFKILKVIFILYLCCAICIKVINVFEKNIKIYFIDVGQGDSTLIITEKNKNILIDGGGSEFGESSTGEDVLIPYLLNRRIYKLDYVFISHMDSDHVRRSFNDIGKFQSK